MKKKIFKECIYKIWNSQVVLEVKNPPADAEHTRDMGSIPVSGRSPAGGHGNPLQYSHLENSMDRGAWQATVHGVPKSWTRLKRLRMHTCIMYNQDTSGFNTRVNNIVK